MVQFLNSIPDYELMDKTQYFDELPSSVVQYVNAEDPGYNSSGNEFVRLINNFKEVSIAAIENSKMGENDTVVKKKWDQNKSSLIKQINNGFSTMKLKSEEEMTQLPVG